MTSIINKDIEDYFKYTFKLKELEENIEKQLRQVINEDEDTPIIEAVQLNSYEEESNCEVVILFEEDVILNNDILKKLEECIGVPGELSISWNVFNLVYTIKKRGDND